MSNSPFGVISVTTSLELSSNNYGNGGKRFVSLRAETPVEAPGTLSEALDMSLQMHLTAFESATAAQVSAGEIDITVYNQQREKFSKRIAKLRAFFTQED